MQTALVICWISVCSFDDQNTVENWKKYHTFKHRILVFAFSDHNFSGGTCKV